MRVAVKQLDQRSRLVLQPLVLSLAVAVDVGVTHGLTHAQARGSTR